MTSIGSASITLDAESGKLHESGTALVEGMDAPVIVQRQVPIVRKVQKTVEVLQAQSTDEVVDTPMIMQRQVQAIQVAQKTVKDPQTQSIVKELRSKFEVGHTSKVHARNQPDKNRWRKKQGFEDKQYPQNAQERADLTNQRQVPAIRSVQKTVEVPRVQYIDKVADIPVDVQRRGSIIQAAQHDLQHIDDDVHVPALMQIEVQPSQTQTICARTRLETKIGLSMRTRRG